MEVFLFTSLEFMSSQITPNSKDGKARRKEADVGKKKGDTHERENSDVEESEKERGNQLCLKNTWRWYSVLWAGDKVGIGHRLDLRVLEIFFNLSDSMPGKYK